MEIRTKSAPTEQISYGTIVYQWRYETSGVARDNPPLEARAPVGPPRAQADKVSVTEVKREEPKAPEAKTSAALAPFEQAEAFIAMLNRAIGVPEGDAPYLRYEMLADQLRIIPTSPTWDAVRAAGNKLRSAATTTAQRSMDEGLGARFLPNTRALPPEYRECHRLQRCHWSCN